MVCRKTRSDCRRRIEMMQVKPPRAKTIIRAMRCRLGRCSWLRKGRGRVATRMSVRMFMPALENLGFENWLGGEDFGGSDGVPYQTTHWLKHLPFGIVL